MVLPSWLKTIAQIAEVVLTFIPGFPAGPGIAALTADAIAAAEQPNTTGPAKLATATTIVNDGIAAANQIAGKTIINPTLAASAVQAGISAVVQTANVIEAAKSALAS